MPEKLNLSVREAAKLLGVSHTQVYTHLIGKRGFPAYQIGERWVIPRASLEEWNQAQAEKRAAAPAATGTTANY